MPYCNAHRSVPASPNDEDLAMCALSQDLFGQAANDGVPVPTASPVQFGQKVTIMRIKSPIPVRVCYCCV